MTFKIFSVVVENLEQSTSTDHPFHLSSLFLANVMLIQEISKNEIDKIHTCSLMSKQSQPLEFGLFVLTFGNRHGFFNLPFSNSNGQEDIGVYSALSTFILFAAEAKRA